MRAGIQGGFFFDRRPFFFRSWGGSKMVQSLMVSVYRHLQDNLRHRRPVAEATNHFEKGARQKRLDKENTTPLNLVGRLSR
jgi:hypothetical protein